MNLHQQALSLAYEDQQHEQAERYMEGQEMITKAFTFGYSHTDPRTEQLLRNSYVVITAPSEQVCYTLMTALFGDKWAFAYNSAEDLIAKNSGYGEPMREHMNITVREPEPFTVTEHETNDDCGSPFRGPHLHVKRVPSE